MSSLGNYDPRDYAIDLEDDLKSLYSMYEDQISKIDGVIRLEFDGMNWKASVYSRKDDFSIVSNLKKTPCEATDDLSDKLDEI